MYMLDTNICIYIIKRKPENILSQLEKHKDDGLFISAITLAELEFGNENSLYKEQNRIALIEFLTIINIKYFDEKAAREYGIIRKDLKNRNSIIGQLDMLIGAHAKSLNMILVTNNVREFERIKDLKIENWV
ncbi:MAG: type II toxin-antitoxin system VapC family toxin [Leptospirales bacterium]|nr:type II toxin-antitoxin system VapC family toxin [Leptospirales bacterium]